MTKHTQGPWEMKTFKDGTRHIISGENTNSICGGYISEANARLIASAPELLETLKESLLIINGTNIHTPIGEMDNLQKLIEQAIAKAEGKSSCCGCPQGKEYIHCGCDCHKAEGKKECGHEPEDTQYCNCHKAEGK